MLPVNPNSRISAQGFVDNVTKTTCLPDWMKTVFVANGHDLQIAAKFKGSYTFLKGTKPAWFDPWLIAATSAWQQDEWQLTTGTLEMKPKDLSIMVPDGVSIGKFDPDHNWTNFPVLGTDDTGAGGITVPTQDTKDGLNALSDADLHYSGVIV